ncbi:MAG: methyltransferase [Nitrososphaerota archaeon]
MSAGSSDHESNTMSPPEELRRLFELMGGYRVTQALYVAAKLGIADLLAGGPNTANDLAAATGANSDALYRLLRMLANIGVFEEAADRQFTLTPMATLLQQDHPYSLRAQALLFGGDGYRAFGGLLHTVMTGETAFNHVFGAGHFAYLAEHPEESAIFSQAMSASSRRVVPAIVGAYYFSSAQTVADIGGGQGMLLGAVLRANLTLRGILFDEAHVVAMAEPVLAAAGIADRCACVAGDFFAAVPPGADIYMLRHIVHDWDDECSVAILRNCAEAAGTGGKVLVIESIVEPGNGFSTVKMLDVQMLVMNGGRERTAEEYRQLFTAAGLALTRIIPAGAESLIEGERA